MPLKFKLSRKSDSDLQGYQGEEGEISYNIDGPYIHIHDGIKEGGYRLVKDVLERDMTLNGGKIVDSYDVPLVSEQGLYPYVYEVSLDSNGNYPSSEVLKNAPAPSPKGNGKWHVVLGRDSRGDGFAGIYYADVNDTDPPSEQNFRKIPIQGDSTRGHWIYSPISPANNQIRVLSRTNGMEIANIASGTRVFTDTQVGEEYVPTQINFIIRSISNVIAADTEFEFGLFDGQNNADNTFSLNSSSGNFEVNRVLSYNFIDSRVFSFDQKSFIRVSNSSSGVGSVIADVILFGYTI